MHGMELNSPPQHPMAVVTRKTGLRADVIRAWERRYSAIVPRRTPGNRRLYSDDDVRRLLLLRRALDAGWQISQVANLPDPEIEALVAADVTDHTPPAHAATGDASGHIERCLAAIAELDSEQLERVIGEASVALSRVELLDSMLVPLMEKVGEACAAGSLRTAHEHMTTAVVRTHLDSLHPAYPPSPTAPCLLVTTPSNQNHELGALFVLAASRIEGWRTVYLGPNLPAEEIAAAARQRRATILALSVTFPGDDPVIAQELRRLGPLLPASTTVLVGGRSAASYREVLDEIGARRLDDLAQLRGFLQTAPLPSPRVAP